LLDIDGFHLINRPMASAKATACCKRWATCCC
jgi:hypothetical protein